MLADLISLEKIALDHNAITGWGKSAFTVSRKINLVEDEGAVCKMRGLYVKGDK